MEGFWFAVCFKFHSILRCKNFIGDWSPTIPFDSLVPAIEIIFLRFVVSDVNCILSVILLKFHVITRSEGADVDNTSVSEDLVID